MNTRHPSRAEAAITMSLLSMGTVLGLAGTDLVLPAVPVLPELLGGKTQDAQYVLAAYVAGAGIGLVLFGALGARFRQTSLLVVSLLSFGVLSLAIVAAETLLQVTILRFFQGLSGSAAAVFAPGIIRALYDANGAVRAIGLLSSVESLAPALAPLAGLWLLNEYGWTASFYVTGLLALLLAMIAATGVRRILPAIEPSGSTLRTGGYPDLIRNLVFVRYALSQSCCLGGLLVFVFGAPVVIVHSLHGSLTDFVIMQVSGIAFFIAGANASGWLVRRFGVEPVILAGTGLSAVGALALLVYGLVDGGNPRVLAMLFVPMNLGLGLRGPPGFYQAVVAAGEDSARGAALVILAVQLTAAAGTVLAAEWIVQGLVPLTAVAATISIAALVVLAILPAADRRQPEKKREA